MFLVHGSNLKVFAAFEENLFIANGTSYDKIAVVDGLSSLKNFTWFLHGFQFYLPDFFPRLFFSFLRFFLPLIKETFRRIGQFHRASFRRPSF